ncbi:hypothetical protein ACFL54_08320 [Planctomycetota bacterium]
MAAKIKLPEEFMTKKIFFILLAGLSIRLIFAPITQDIFDFDNWIRFGQRILEGNNPYTTNYGPGNLPYTYAPLWSWICATMSWPVQMISQNSDGKWLLRLCLKLPSILADCALALTLYHISPKGKNIQVMCLYLFNPLVICISSMWGMFDAIPTVLLLACMILIKHNKMIRSAFLFGISCSFKFVYPAFVFPWLLLYIFRKNDLKTAFCFFCISFGTIVGLSLYYLVQDPQAMIISMFVFHSQRPPQILNLWTFISYCNLSANIWIIPLANTFLPVGLLGLFLFLVKKNKNKLNQDDWPALVFGVLILILGFFCFSKVVNEPYTLWLITFLLIPFAFGHKRALTYYILQSTLCIVVISTNIGLSFFEPVASNLPHMGEFYRYKLRGVAALTFWLLNISMLIYFMRLFVAYFHNDMATIEKKE